MGGQPDEITQTSEPPKFLQPYIKDILGQSQSLYNNFTPQYFPGSTVAPLSPYTAQATDQLAGFGNSTFNQNVVGGGLQAQQNLVGSGNNLAAAIGGSQALAASPYYDYLRARAVTGDSSSLAGQGSDLTSAASQGLQGQITAAPGSSPYVDELVQQTLQANTREFQQNALPSIQNAAQLQGGYGGSRQGVAEGIGLQGLNDANANAAASIYSNQYNQDLNRGLQASATGLNYGIQQGGLDLAFQNALQQNALSGSSLGQGLLVPGINAGIQGNQAALALTPGLQQTGLTGTQSLLGAGDIDNAYRQALLNDEVNRFNFTQAQPYAALEQYRNSVYGLPGLGGGTQSTPTSSGGFAGALGGAATGLGLVSGISSAFPAAAGVMSGPVGWGIIGLGALLGGLG